MLRARLTALPLALLLALWLPGFNQGAFRVDTGLYSAIGVRAWREGPLWPLMAGDAPYFNKPPVGIWIHGAALHLLGVELWAARLPSLLAAMGCVVALRSIVRRVNGARAGTAAACVLALTLEFFRYARAVSLDLWVTLFLLMAAWCVVRTREARAAHGVIGWMALSGAPVGLALLTKPISPLLAFACFGVWGLGRPAIRPMALADSRRSPRRPTARNPWRAVVGLALAGITAMIVALAWYVPMYLRFGEAFVGQHFTKQAVERATGESFGAEPWWYYFRLIGETHWPWLVPSIGAWVMLARGRMSARDRAGAIACLWWLGIWMVALSAFAGKSGRYAVVMYPMLAWLAAIPMARARARVLVFARRAAVRWLAPVMLIGAAAMMVFGVRVHDPAPPHWEALYEFVREHAGGEVWAGTEMRAACANVYLATGRWPRTVSDATPRGAIVIGRQELGAAGEVDGKVVWRSGPMYAVERAGD
jgi:4-amino-4-deoxy-L-arabinose transferase-like glycosyltransferase